MFGIRFCGFADGKKSWNAHDGALHAVEVGLRQVVNALLRVVQAARQLEHGRRIDAVDQRVDDAERVDVVGVLHLRPVALQEQPGARPGVATGADLMTELHAAVERGAGTHVPVDAQHLIGAQLLDDPFPLVVVLPRARRIGRVGQRELVQDVLTDRVDHRLRNDVAVEARPADARVDVARPGLARVADEPEAPLVVPRLREVALAFDRRRHRPSLQTARILAWQQILREEEEELVALAVERRARNQDRAADRPRRVVVPVRRLFAVRVGLPVHHRVRVAAAAPVPGIRVVILVTTEVRRRSPELGAAALGDDDDRRARGAAVLGLEVRGLDLHLGD